MSFRSAPGTLLLALTCTALTGLGRAAAQDTAKRALTPADYGKWESLGFGHRISPDGKWLAYPIERVNEDNELRIAPLDRDTTIVVLYGESPQFSEDGRWLAYAIGVSAKERARLTKDKKPVHTRLGLRNLVTGDTLGVADVAGFTFSDDGRFLAMRRYAPEGGASRKQHGVDLVVRDLAAGTETNFGNVSEYAWQDKGSLLAMVVDAEGQAGNGVALFDPASGRLRTLESKATRYESLTWREDDDDLAAMRVRADDKRYKDSTYVVLAWRDLAGKRPAAFVFDPDSTAGFPADMRVVTYAGVRWSDDARTLYFGIKEREKAEAKDSTAKTDSTAARDSTRAPRDSTAAKPGSKADADEEPSTVQVWNAKDVDIYPEQKVAADRDRRRNHLIAWQLDAGRFVRLGTELTEDVTLAKGDRWAIGTDRTPYEKDRMFGPAYQDLYRIDVGTGAATLIMPRVQYNFGASSAGKYLLYLMKDQYWTYDLATEKQTNVTAGLGPSFVDLKDDHPVDQKPPFGTGGWTKDDKSVLLYDRYDVWDVRPDGTAARRLTNGAPDSIRYRRVRLDPDEKYVDAAQPVYLAAAGEWSKRNGYSRLVGGKLERLVWEDAGIGRLTKAKKADVFLYVAQDFDRSPDYYVAGPTLAGARQVSHTNPFQHEYRWGRSELIEYKNDWGERLQGALFYPADYEPGKQYPMIVYIYEIRSPAVHQYVVPSDRSAYDPTVWTSQGYFVLQPDIVYRDRDPGRSAVAAIVPAVKAVLATGMVDPKKVGLTGHSWGGYQTAFVVTQTDVFAAAVAGAPLTDLVSMYLSVYWNSGGTDARIFEISQGRMAVPFWEDVDAYIANSPVFHVEQLHTPLLVAQGTEDGAVDFNQGVEYYNAARRAGKDFVFLVYEGENHGNAKKANQIDYHNRIMEWFGHYLKGDPAPEWISKGVSYLDQEKAKKKDGKPTADSR
jgi:dipeptidyl aminopeptidase/acylaminoacyl peptidase